MRLIMPQNAYKISFSSVNIFSRDDYSKFQQIFASFGKVLKVFINTRSKSGMVLFELKEDAENAFETLHKEMTLAIVPQKPLLVQFRTVNEDTEFETDKMYDIYGNNLTVATSDDGDVFVSLKSLEVVGFKLYSSDISKDFVKGDEGWLQQLNQFLQQQALVFSSMTKTITDKKKVDFIINGVSSKHSNSDTKSNSSALSRSKVPQVDLQLNADHTVKILSKTSKVDIYWTTLVANSELMQRIKSEMKLCSEKISLASLKTGAVCGIRIKHSWVRCRIIKLDPLECFCIDTGFSQRNITLQDLFEIPQSLLDIPGQAIRIRIDDHSEKTSNENFAIGDILLITPVKKYNDGTYLAKNQINPQNIVVQVGNSPGNNSKTFTRPHIENGNNDRRSFPTTSSDKCNNKVTFPSRSESRSDTKLENGNNGRRSFPSTSSYDRNNKPTFQSRSDNKKNDVEEIVIKGKEEMTSPKPQEEIQPSKPQKRVSSLLAKIKEAKTAKPVIINRTYVGEFLEGTTGSITCIEKSPEKIILFVVPETLIDDLNKVITIPNNLPTKTAVTIGDFVGVFHDGAITRCIVTKFIENDYEVALIDFGVKKITSKVFDLSVSYRLIPEFIVTSKAEDVPLIEVDEEYAFKSSKNFELSFLDRTIKCDIWDIFGTNDQKEVKKPAQKVIKHLPEANETLKLGDMVMLINIHGGDFGFRTKKMYDENNNLMEKLKAHSYVKLDHEIEVGEYVLHKKDGDNKRCLVLSKTSTGVLVKYVDFNFTECVSADDLFYISDFSEIPCTIKLVKLKGYENKLLSEKAKKFLETVMKKRSTISFIYGNTVDILWGDKNLTDLIKEAERPVYETIESLPKKSFVEGAIYPMLVAVNDTDDEHMKFSLADSDSIEQLTAVTKELTGSEAYEKPLNLHVEELCIALFEGEWYRAQVNEILDSERYLVYYMDFGNLDTVSLSDVRVMPPEFMKYPPLAVKCIIKGEDTPEIRSKLQVDEIYQLKLYPCATQHVYEVEVVDF